MVYSLESYHYHLPKELIAQYPCERRDRSRLLVIDRQSGAFSDLVFADLKDLLKAQDSLVMNESKVFPCRLLGKRQGGGQAEVFLLKRLQEQTWEALVKPGKRLAPGARVFFENQLELTVLDKLDNHNRIVHFASLEQESQILEKRAQIPLPQYIERQPETQIDQERYQTVYAKTTGSVAAPTAGLHFTKELLADLHHRGVASHRLTLHVGLGTFQPVKTEDIREHQMHKEFVLIDQDTANFLNQRPSSAKQICVGTTTCRALETASTPEGLIRAGQYETEIFIYPGYQFKYVQHLLTNFHAPGSSLLMLVSAFAGYDLMKEAYLKAVKDRYRFLSYGDAMLIL